MPYTYNKGCRIYYQQRGQGTPIVLIRDVESQYALERNMQEFSDHFKVLAWDMRGTGRSGASTEKITMKLLADDLRYVLDDAGIEKAYIIGVSTGGLIAQSFCHEYQDRVAGLILVSTGVGPADPAFIHPDKKVLDVVKLKWELNDIKQYLSEYVKPVKAREMTESQPELAGNLLGKFSHQEHFSMHQGHLEACFEKSDYSARLREIKAPALILHGNKDKQWPVANARYMSEHIRGSQLELFEHSGAQLIDEHSELIRQRIISFVDRVEHNSDLTAIGRMWEEKQRQLSI